LQKAEIFKKEVFSSDTVGAMIKEENIQGDTLLMKNKLKHFRELRIFRAL
jgi:hypothetical protein